MPQLSVSARARDFVRQLSGLDITEAAEIIAEEVKKNPKLQAAVDEIVEWGGQLTEKDIEHITKQYKTREDLEFDPKKTILTTLVLRAERSLDKIATEEDFRKILQNPDSSNRIRDELEDYKDGFIGHLLTQSDAKARRSIKFRSSLEKAMERIEYIETDLKKIGFNDLIRKSSVRINTQGNIHNMARRDPWSSVMSGATGEGGGGGSYTSGPKEPVSICSISGGIDEPEEWECLGIIVIVIIGIILL